MATTKRLLERVTPRQMALDIVGRVRQLEDDIKAGGERADAARRSLAKLYKTADADWQRDGGWIDGPVRRLQRRVQVMREQHPPDESDVGVRAHLVAALASAAKVMQSPPAGVPVTWTAAELVRSRFAALAPSYAEKLASVSDAQLAAAVEASARKGGAPRGTRTPGAPSNSKHARVAEILASMGLKVSARTAEKAASIIKQRKPPQ